MARIYNEEQIAEINIIPFVDIILVILIVFMVTAPLLIQKGFSVKLPQASSSTRQPPSKVQIAISNTGDLLIKGQLVSTKDLAFYIRKLLENGPISSVTIQADRSVSHGRVIEIVNIIKTNGVNRFSFATQ